MDGAEARGLLRELLAEWRARSRTELVAHVGAEPATGALVGASGTRYEYEIEAFWDREPGGVLRVQALIDDGGLRALKPLCDDFLMAADGSFVGEDGA